MCVLHVYVASAAAPLIHRAHNSSTTWTGCFFDVNFFCAIVAVVLTYLQRAIKNKIRGRKMRTKKNRLSSFP